VDGYTDSPPLVSDSAGGLWAGTYGGGVSHYDPDQDTWQAFTVASTDGGLGSNDNGKNWPARINPSPHLRYLNLMMMLLISSRMVEKVE